MFKQTFDAARTLIISLLLATSFLSPAVFGADGVSKPEAAPAKAERAVDYFMVPRSLVGRLPAGSERVHDYGGRSLMRIPAGALGGELRAASSELEDLDSLGYRTWRGSLQGHDPAELPDLANGYVLLGLVGPMDPAWRTAIEQAGLVIVDHATPYGLLVRGDSRTISTAAATITTSEGDPVIRHALRLPEQARVAPRISDWLTGRSSARDLGMRDQDGKAVVRVIFHADSDIPGIQRRVNAILNRGP